MVHKWDLVLLLVLAWVGGFLTCYYIGPRHSKKPKSAWDLLEPFSEWDLSHTPEANDFHIDTERLMKSVARFPGTFSVGCGLFIFMALSSGSHISSRALIYSRVIHYGEWRRLLLSGLSHANVFHLFTNLWSLWDLRILERDLDFDWTEYIFFNLGLLLLTSCVHLVLVGFLKALNGTYSHEIGSVGYSGALCGLVAFGSFYWDNFLLLKIHLLPAIFLPLIFSEISIVSHVAGFIAGSIAWHTKNYWLGILLSMR